MKVVPPGMDGIPLAGKLGHDCSYCESHRKQQYFLRCPNCGRLLYGLKEESVTDKTPMDQAITHMSDTWQLVEKALAEAVEVIKTAANVETSVHDARKWTFHHPDGDQREFNADQMAAEIQRLYGDMSKAKSNDWPNPQYGYSFDHGLDHFAYETVDDMKNHLITLIDALQKAQQENKLLFTANQKMDDYLTRIRMIANNPDLRIAT